MSELDGVLGNYIGIGMAAMLLGKPMRHTGEVYSLVKEHNIPKYKIGGTSLLEYESFAKSAGIGGDSLCPLWPDEFIDIPMSRLYSRWELADALGVSIGTIYNMVEHGEVVALDLSPWKMNTLYYFSGDMPQISQPSFVDIDDTRIKVSRKEDGAIKIDIWKEDADKVEAACWEHEPSKAWFSGGKGPVIAIEVHKKELYG